MSKALLFSILGALTGFFVSQISFQSNFKEIEIALFAFCLFVASFTLLWNKIPQLTLIKCLAILAIILTAVTAYFYTQDYQLIRRGGIQAIFGIGLIQITVICTTFFQSWKSNKPHYNYDDLFENAWSNHFFYIFSGLLLGAFLLILALGTYLFDMLGFKASDLIWNEKVVPVIIGALLGAGVGISRDYEKLIFTFRSIFFALFKVLAYLTATILILFALVLPFTYESLFENKNTSLILLSIVAISILLLNALKDTDFNKFPKFTRWMFNIQIVLLPIFSLLSIYAIYLRVQQYGLMPNRIIAFWIAILISAHAIGYLIQLIINKGQWNQGFAKVNPPLAFFWVLSIVLLVSPLLDPIKLSVNNQVERLKSNKVAVDKFDYYVLKERLGKPGKQAIANISNWNGHPEIDLIKTKISKAKRRRAPNKFNISLIGQAPDNLQQLKDRYKTWRCNDKFPCFIKLMKLNENDSLQPMVFYYRKQSDGKYRLTSDYMIYDNTWKKIVTFKSEAMGKKEIEKTIESIKNSEAELIEPKYSDFNIEGIPFRQ